MRLVERGAVQAVATSASGVGVGRRAQRRVSAEVEALAAALSAADRAQLRRLAAGIVAPA
jgi:hypothetical protein